MWRDYSKSYIKNNRVSSASIMAAALIATLFLSLLCTLFYNFWTYEIERIVLAEGEWQGRIVAKIDQNGLLAIQNFANVDKAVVNEELSVGKEIVVDILFHNARTVYRDIPLIAEQLGLDDNAVEYHSLLLSRYFIHDPRDAQPPLLMAFYLGLLIMVSFSLILIIRNSFELSMNARIHQFGIFSSIGATPKQIRTCLIQEAAVLCTIPIILGCLLGIAISFGILEAINIFAAGVAGRHNAVFQYHPLVFAITILSAVVTAFISAWIPARRLSRMTPLEAIRNTGGLQLKKRKGSGILRLLFGIEGELAGNALKAQKKALRISALSLLFSFLGFSVMLCFFTLSGISTRYTYFERYQDAWDVMATVKDTPIADFGLTEDLYRISGARDITLYQKANETSLISEDRQSDELIALGGLEAVAKTALPREEGKLLVETPIIILDDDSFLEYCSQIGVAPGLEGAIVLNRIWDSINSNFRQKEYVPFVKEGWEPTPLYSIDRDRQIVEVPVLSYTQKVPILREEYDNYTLVHFIPLSMWKNLSGQLDGAEKDSYIRILSDDTTHEDLNDLERRVVQLIEQKYDIESENRIREKLSNDDIMRGAMLLWGALCVLLAIIGIVNVFSNTLGFLRQRKREFAQYMSIGLTPSEMQKMFCIEALVIAGKPLLITLPLTVMFVQFGVTASYLDPMVFWAEAPIGPISIFAMAIVGFVAMAYYIGGKRILQCDLNETLRNDTMV